MDPLFVRAPLQLLQQKVTFQQSHTVAMTNIPPEKSMWVFSQLCLLCTWACPNRARGRSTLDFLAIEFMISLHFKRNSEHNHQPLPIFASQAYTKWSHLYISLAVLATNSNLCIAVSLVISNLRFPWFSNVIQLIDHHETGMEEWSAFHQYSHLMVKPSGLISIVALPILPQT